MNTRQVIDTSPGPVSLSSAFNSDSSCFAVGLDSGFCVYSSDPCELRVSRDFNAGIGVVEMLGQSNYMALVGGGRKPKFPQNKLVIWDDVRQKPVITLEFRTSVLRVRITRSYIVVALHNSVHIFAFSIPPTKKSVFDTADNPLGLVCLGDSRVVFPGRTVGQVQLVELETGNVSIIPAHNTPLRAIDLSPDGSVLATASQSGTLIRIFATSNCAKVEDLRRGVDYAEIYSVAISPSNLYLAVTSDKSTLHIFDLAHSRNSAQSQHSNHDPEEDAHQKWGILSRMPLLPRLFSDKYSFASTPFDNGDEPPPGASYVPQLGSSFGRPSKGVIGWLNDEELLVISAGQEGKWQKFIIAEGNEGKRICVRQGWKRYLGGG